MNKKCKLFFHLFNFLCHRYIFTFSVEMVLGTSTSRTANSFNLFLFFLELQNLELIFIFWIFCTCWIISSFIVLLDLKVEVEDKMVFSNIPSFQILVGHFHWKRHSFGLTCCWQLWIAILGASVKAFCRQVRFLLVSNVCTINKYMQ